MKKLRFFEVPVLIHHAKKKATWMHGTANLIWSALVEMDRLDLYESFTEFQGIGTHSADHVKLGGYAVICEEDWCDTLQEELESIYNQHKR